MLCESSGWLKQPQVCGFEAELSIRLAFRRAVPSYSKGGNFARRSNGKITARTEERAPLQGAPPSLGNK